MNQLLYLEARAEKAAARQVTLVASTESLDSHGTIVRQNWRLDRFKLNPVVLYGHDRSSIPVAMATKISLEGAKGSKRLVIVAKFREPGKSPQADATWEAVADGTLRGVSVGFRSHTQRWERHNDAEVLVLDDNELFEVSLVAVPSNAETLAELRSRSRNGSGSPAPAAPPPRPPVGPPVPFEELSFPARARLKREDPAAYDELRTRWIRRGRPQARGPAPNAFAELPFIERQKLREHDRLTYDRMRKSWREAGCPLASWQRKPDPTPGRL